MGLDMYLTGRKYFWQAWDNDGANRREDGKRVKSIDVELGYWRKHPDLHGYIVNTFAGGKDDCKEIELTADNLREIVKAVRARTLPHTTGFFFGESDLSDEEIDGDVKTLEGAIDWLQAGDEEPFVTEPAESGPGFSMTIVKPKPDEAKTAAQRVSRSVHYQASW